MMYLSSTGKNPITGEVTSYKTAVIKVIEVIDLTVLQVIKRHIPGRAVNGLSFAFFLRRSSSSGSRARASEVENCRNGRKSGTF